MQLWKRTTMLTVLILASVVTGQTQEMLPAPETFWVLAATLADNPVTTRQQFAELEPEIKKMGFVQVSSSAWRYTNAGDVVVLKAFPDQGSFYVELLPGISTTLGDTSLAALINKAASVSFDLGDSIELLVSQRRTSKQGGSVEITEYLSFKLSGGRWWRTARHIKWSK